MKLGRAAGGTLRAAWWTLRPEWRKLRAAWSMLRVASWTLRAARTAHRQLERGGLDAVSLPAAPRLPADAARGMRLVLRLRRERCLVSAAVRQAWHASQGSRRDLVIGVTAPGDGFTAHAWLEGDRAATGFAEIARREALSATRARG